MRNATPAHVDDIDRFFREIVLCLGGIFAAHGCDDALIRQGMRSLERIYDRACARRQEQAGGAGGPPKPRLIPHPAVEDLLCRIGRSA